MSVGSGALRVGCSGWNYKPWRGRFYPSELPVREWLAYYAAQFDTVEINNTFYRLPERATFTGWRRQTPDGFLFAVKASRYLTHLKRLKEPADPLKRLFAAARGLGPRLGPVLYQLPGQFKLNLERLEVFLRNLPGRRRSRQASRVPPLRHVMEFRDRSWYVPEVFQLLDRAGVTLCLHDRIGSEIAGPFIGPIVYVRFHGPTGRYAGRYPEAALRQWGERFIAQRRAGIDVFAYFNNDIDAAAPHDAALLRGYAR